MLILKYLLIIGGFTISISLATQHMTIIENIRNELEEYVQELKLQEEETSTTIDVKQIKIEDNELQKLLEELISILKPVAEYWDPYTLAHYELDIDTPLLKLKGELDQMHISEFGDFIENKLNVTENLDFDVGFGLPRLIVDGNYDLDFNVMTLLPLFGNGQFRVALVGLNISSSMKLISGQNDILQAQTLNLDFNVDQIDFEIGGLLGGGKLSDFVNGVLTDVAAEILMEYKGVLMSIIDPILKFKLNSYMLANEITYPKLVDIIKKIIHQIDPKS